MADSPASENPAKPNRRRTGRRAIPSDVVPNNRDTAEFEATAAELAANEELLRLFVRYTPAAVAMFDTEMRYLQVSDRWVKDYHLDGREITGRSHYEVFPDIPERWKEIHRRCLAGAVESCDEDPFPRADGRTDWLQWEIRPWMKAGGGIGGVIFFTQVITERKRTAALLLESERRFREAIEFSALGISLSGLDGRFQHVNRAFCDMLGYTEEEMLGLMFVDVTHPEDREMDRKMRGAMFAGTSDRLRFDKRYLHKSGQTVWASVAITFVRDANGQPVQWLAQVENMTPRHEAEKRLKASLEEKATLLQEVHHRVKNNLQVVSSMISLQCGYIRDPDALAMFRECEGRIRAMALIHEQLYQSKTLSKVDLKEYIETLAGSIMRSHARGGKVRLEMNVESIASTLDTAVPLGLIINELLTNAFKHAFPGERSGCLRLGLQAGEEGWMTLKVEDDGIGLPADFSPTHPVTLGFRLVSLFVRQLRAVLTVHARVPGTCFEIRISMAGLT